MRKNVQEVESRETKDLCSFTPSLKYLHATD
jgi:hypothetical protein